MAFFNDSRMALPLLDTPVLIVQPARDVLVPLAVGYYLHEQLPDCQLVIIDASGHFPHLTAPDATLAAIGRFLGRPLALPAGTAVSWAALKCLPIGSGWALARHG